jgi:polyhydroxyalkanoate synthesis regulator phasin
MIRPRSVDAGRVLSAIVPSGGSTMNTTTDTRTNPHEPFQHELCDALDWAGEIAEAEARRLADELHRMRAECGGRHADSWMSLGAMLEGERRHIEEMMSGMERPENLTDDARRFWHELDNVRAYLGRAVVAWYRIGRTA